MGTLVGHIVPSIVLVAVGLWHLLAMFTNYVYSPREYVAKAWHPATWLPNRWKQIELWLLVLFIPLAIFYELGISTNFEAIVDGIIPKNRVTSFEHSTTLIMFWMFAVIVLLSETTNVLPFPPDASFLFASIASEWSVSLSLTKPRGTRAWRANATCCLLTLPACVLSLQVRTLFVDFDCSQCDK